MTNLQPQLEAMCPQPHLVDFDVYTKLAMKTDYQGYVPKLNPHLLKLTLELFASVANFLDMYKKVMFQGRKVEHPDLASLSDEEALNVTEFLSKRVEDQRKTRKALLQVFEKIAAFSEAFNPMAEGSDCLFTSAFCDTTPAQELSVKCEGQRTKAFSGLLGIVTEAGEVAEELVKVLDGKAFDRNNAIAEVGDLAWYIAQFLEAMEINLPTALRANIIKLAARFGDKFNVDRCEVRNLDTENAEIAVALQS